MINTREYLFEGYADAMMTISKVNLINIRYFVGKMFRIMLIQNTKKTCIFDANLMF